MSRRVFLSFVAEKLFQRLLSVAPRALLVGVSSSIFWVGFLSVLVGGEFSVHSDLLVILFHSVKIFIPKYFTLLIKIILLH